MQRASHLPAKQNRQALAELIITASLSSMHTVGTEVDNGSAADLHALTEQHANNEDQSARRYACLRLVPRCIALVCETCLQNLHDPDHEMSGSLSLCMSCSAALPKLVDTLNSD